MTTEAQTAANRQNAQQATGPKTIQGKARAALNGLKHGLCARVILEEAEPTTGERSAPFAALLFDLIQELQPVGVLESFCVETIALSQWRLCRVLSHELILTQQQGLSDAWEHTPPGSLPAIWPPPYSALPNPEKLLPLVRYEAHLHRLRSRALADLAALQERRLAGAETAQAPSRPSEPSAAAPGYPATANSPLRSSVSSVDEARYPVTANSPLPSSEPFADEPGYLATANSPLRSSESSAGESRYPVTGTNLPYPAPYPTATEVETTAPPSANLPIEPNSAPDATGAACPTAPRSASPASRSPQTDTVEVETSPRDCSAQPGQWAGATASAASLPELPNEPNSAVPGGRAIHSSPNPSSVFPPFASGGLRRRS